MSEFHFLRPLWLYALPALFGLLYWFWHRQLHSRSWQAICDPELLPHLLIGRSQRRADWPFWLLLIALFLVLTALAGPTWERRPEPLFRQQSALVLLLDLSRSMNATDLKPSRLERARLKVHDILDQRREGETALIVFAGDAFAVTPLSDDSQTIAALIDSLDPELMPVQGSRPRTAIELGVKLLQQAGLQQGRLLLITDEDRPRKGEQAAVELAAAGYELAILGVGTRAGAPIPLPDGGFFKDADGNLVLPQLDEDGLRRLAVAGGGSYRRLQVGDGDIESLLAGLDSHDLNRDQTSHTLGDRWKEAGIWLLLPLLLLAASAFRRGWLTLLLVGCLLPSPAEALNWPALWQRPDQQGAAAFAHKNYRSAAETFTDPDWRAAAAYRKGDFAAALKDLDQPTTAESWYNRGNALARSGDFPNALAAWDETLKLDPSHADAQANKEIVQQALRDTDPQQQAQEPKDGRKEADSDKESSPPQKPASEQEQTGQTDESSEQQPGATGDDEPSERPAKPEKNRSDPAEPIEQPPSEKGQNLERSEGQSAQLEDSTETTDQQQEMNQWLRRIPDDPGGLLRRKFLYQYRQRGGQQETERPW